MTAEPATSRPGRGRRPAAEVRAAVLAAAGAMLLENGLRDITFEKVATRAGASKMTLYKWWPSPGALAFDAYFAATEQTLAFEDTGDLARDLVHQLRAFVGFLTSREHGPVVAELVGAAQSDPDLAAALAERYTLPRRALAVARLRTAKDAGQLRADVDLESVVDQLWGACYHRLLLPARPLDPGFADTLVRNLLPGVSPPH
ncbi:TetR-like C-terminal domain-containing protein [Streptomyces sp. NBC_01477]|uniref:TetR-like C-terminal domain-containing protein n=1 Tax=Streptomyces sp. NBC_01477 TaxID=2976015 RepID=UPI002E30A739|nr:TetR-like C-terminal domain-containing protein [Streptomyces sp. NBC_01477]